MVFVLWICIYVCSVCACCVFMFVVCKDIYVNGELCLYVTVYVLVVCVYFYCIQWAYGYMCPCVYMQSTEEEPMCFPLLLLSWLPWNEPKPQMCRQWTLRICLSKDHNAGVTDVCSHALLSMLCRRFEIMSCCLHKYSYSLNYLPRTGVTNFTLKFYENEISFPNTKSLEKHEYCVWEVIGHSGASTTIVLLNGHVLTLLYKYLCPHTLVLSIANMTEDSYCNMMWLIWNS